MCAIFAPSGHVAARISRTGRCSGGNVTRSEYRADIQIWGRCLVGNVTRRSRCRTNLAHMSKKRHCLGGNIMRIYHLFSDGGYPCMIVEYCARGRNPNPWPVKGSTTHPWMGSTTPLERAVLPPSSQGQDLASDVPYVPYSLDGGSVLARRRPNIGRMFRWQRDQTEPLSSEYDTYK